MSEIAISVEGLSKSYLVGHRTGTEERYKTFRGAIQHQARNFMRKATNFLRGQQIVQGDRIEEFWALRDLNFDVKRGEILGIIGRNGAGKSTLLKILNRITEPSSGRIKISGRVTSLLEVGTGFHGELTGRENIFLNGAILGMRRSEIVRRLDEIVEFSGVEKFLDTPVKRYSSGMYVRLAFSVAAHLETDILIVDEVLAVGDQEFQQKCLGKMRDVTSHEGRTVLLVSHNLSAICDLAPRALLLESGSVVAEGPSSNVVSSYLSKGRKASVYTVSQIKRDDIPHVSRAEVITSELNSVHRFGEPLTVKFWIRHIQPMSKGCFSFNIVNQFEQSVVHAWLFYTDFRFGTEEGETILTCRFPSLRLNIGQFHLRTHLTEPPGGEVYERLDGLCPFEVVRTDKTIMWGWHPEACAYHECWEWQTTDGEFNRTVDPTHAGSKAKLYQTP